MTSAIVSIDYKEFEEIKADHDRLCFLLSVLGLGCDGCGGFVKTYGDERNPEKERATLDAMMASMGGLNVKNRL